MKKLIKFTFEPSVSLLMAGATVGAVVALMNGEGDAKTLGGAVVICAIAGVVQAIYARHTRDVAEAEAFQATGEIKGQACDMSGLVSLQQKHDALVKASSDTSRVVAELEDVIAGYAEDLRKSREECDSQRAVIDWNRSGWANERDAFAEYKRQNQTVISSTYQDEHNQHLMQEKPVIDTRV